MLILKLAFVVVAFVTAIIVVICWPQFSAVAAMILCCFSLILNAIHMVLERKG